jgi:hypothetical protein
MRTSFLIVVCAAAACVGCGDHETGSAGSTGSGVIPDGWNEVIMVSVPHLDPTAPQADLTCPKDTFKIWTGGDVEDTVGCSECVCGEPNVTPSWNVSAYNNDSCVSGFDVITTNCISIPLERRPTTAIKINPPNINISADIDIMPSRTGEITWKADSVLCGPATGSQLHSTTPGKRCIISVDTAASECPVNYPERHESVSGWDDGRDSCSCECGTKNQSIIAGLGVTVSGVAYFYTQSDCTGPTSAQAIIQPTGPTDSAKCQAMQESAAASASINLTSIIQPSESPQVVTIGGSVLYSGKIVACCM